MSAAHALLADLQSRGVEIIAEGQSLRCRGPRGTLTPADLDRLKTHKRELLTELAHCEDSAEEAALESGVPAAFLIDSPRYGAVWVATDAGVAAAIRVEEQHRDQPRPVVMLDDMARLQGKSSEAIQSVLNVFAVFPGAKVLQ